VAVAILTRNTFTRTKAQVPTTDHSQDSIAHASCLRAFAMAAPTYAKADVVSQTTGTELLSRLEVVVRQPKVILDAGAGSGRHAVPLLTRYPGARLILLEPCAPLLNQFRPGLFNRLRWRSRLTRLTGVAEAIDLADASVDMVFANQSLHWCDIGRAFSEFRRILRPGGLLSFATLGPDTLSELRLAWQEASGVEAAERRLHRFLDMHDLGDALIQAGFAEPVMDVDYLTLTYANSAALFSDLRDCGSRNVRADRPRALTGKQQFHRYVAKIDAQRDTAGRIPLTFELVYGHAWVAETGAAVRTPVDAPIPVSFSTDRRGD